MEKQIHNKLKKDPNRSDDLLSSYSCSKFEKCSFEKNAFKNKSSDFIVLQWRPKKLIVRPPQVSHLVNKQKCKKKCKFSKFQTSCVP